MRILKENTATRVTVGPFLDKTDGVTPEVALTVTNSHLTLTVDDAGVPTLVLDATATASAGSNDMVHITNDNAGFYDLELTAAQLNYTGRCMLAITDAANHCPVFHEFQIVSANVYDSLFTDGDVLDVSVTQWIGTAAATPDTAGHPKVTVKDGTGTGEIALTAGKVDGVALADTVTTLTGHTAQTADHTAGIAAIPTAPALASVCTEARLSELDQATAGKMANQVDEIRTDTGEIGAAGAGLTESGGTGDQFTALPWNAAWDAEVESEVNDAIDTAISELGVAAPTATPTLRTGMMLMYMALRNQLVVQTSGTDAIEIYNDAGTKIAAKTITDDGSDYTEAEMA